MAGVAVAKRFRRRYVDGKIQCYAGLNLQEEEKPVADESQDQPRTAAKRSFWPGIGFLIAAGAAKVVGMAMSESAVGSARSSGSFFGAGQQLQRAANIEGTTTVIMLVLGLIGIILLIRTAMSRSRSENTGR